MKTRESYRSMTAKKRKAVQCTASRYIFAGVRSQIWIVQKHQRMERNDHVFAFVFVCLRLPACLFMTAHVLPLPYLKPLLQAHDSRLTTNCYGISPTKVSLPSPLNQGVLLRVKSSQIPRPSGPICIFGPRVPICILVPGLCATLCNTQAFLANSAIP